MAAVKRGRPKDESRRDEILAVAAKVFAERGILNATVREIGAAAGLLSGSLYYHFTSKDQIIEEIVRPVVETLSSEYAAIGRSTSDPREVIRRVVVVSIEEAARRPDEALIFRNDARHFAEIEGLAFVEEQRRRERTRVATTIRRGMASGAFRADLDVDVVVSAMFDTIFGSVRWVRAAPEGRSQQVAEQIAAFVLGGLCPPAAEHG